MNTDQDFKIIEKFFNYDLSPEELLYFEHSMTHDKAFAQKIKQYQLARNTAHELLVPGYADKLEAQKREWNLNRNVPAKSKRNLTFFLAMAASVTLIFLAGLFLFDNDRLSADEDFHLSLIDDIRYNTMLRSGNDQSVRLLSEALETENYERILSLTKQNTKRVHINNVYRGVALFQLNKYDEAILLFEKIVENNHGHQDLAYWFLYKLYYQKQELQKAEQVLLLIITKDFPIKEQAENELKKAF